MVEEEDSVFFLSIPIFDLLEFKGPLWFDGLSVGPYRSLGEREGRGRAFGRRGGEGNIWSTFFSTVRTRRW